MLVTNSAAKTLEEIAAHVQNGKNYDGKMWIAHSDCIKTANAVVEQLKSSYPRADVRLFEIGPVIGSHCGAGTIAVFFVGDERQA